MRSRTLRSAFVSGASSAEQINWACGVTPQAMVMEARPEIAICHAPGHMLITDARDSRYAVP